MFWEWLSPKKTCGIFWVFFFCFLFFWTLRTILHNGGWKSQTRPGLYFWTFLGPKVTSGWLVEFLSIFLFELHVQFYMMVGKSLKLEHVWNFLAILGPKVDSIILREDFHFLCKISVLYHELCDFDILCSEPFLLLLQKDFPQKRVETECYLVTQWIIILKF